MIYVIIGPSNSGKTTIAKNTFCKGDVRYYTDIVGITESDTAYLIGDYTRSTRRMGTDTLARQDIKKIALQVEKLVDKGKDIVLDGVRMCSRPMMKELLCLGDVRLVYLYCSVEVSIKRNLVYDPTSKVSERAMKAASTAARNLYSEYQKLTPSIMIDTEKVTDFSTFTLDLTRFDTTNPKLF